ncbi:MAG: glycosyltransferase family 4 protein [Chloroflexi bacterium]|nr:glycosyltransferase family 4 protein [Chloroflexota bacterium]
MSIALFISSLSAGGAERVMVFLANNLARLGHRVVLVTFAGDGSSFYRVDPRVERVHLDVRRPSKGKGTYQLRQLRSLRFLLRALRPDVAVSFIVKANILVLLSAWGSGTPVVISDRLDPRAHPLDAARRVLRRLLYPRATTLVVQTDSALSFYPKSVRRRATVVPNPVPRPPKATIADRGGGAPRAPLMVAMGRLHEQKGFDLLLRAFSSIRARHPTWRLEIWGEGKERGRLERLVVELGMQGEVKLPGLTNEPQKVLFGTELFVMSSRREGFPNALCEAMACGCAVISFDCPSGPADIIRPGIDGLLVPPRDVSSLAVAMDRLMADHAERRRLGSNALSVVERFSSSRVMAQWTELLSRAAAESHRA